MFKSINCEKFEYVCVSEESVLALSSELRFTAQTPKDAELLERAIFIELKIKNQDNTFKLNCAFRVIFSFETPDDIIEGADLLKKHQEEAYNRVKEISRAFLKSIYQNENAFPDIPLNGA